MSDPFYKQKTLPEFPPQKEALPIPEKIGPYKIDSLLNKGGMSLLYLGVDETQRKALAIKVLSPEFVNQHGAIERFLKEAKIIGLSDHPNIIQLYGQGEWEGGLYIAMELIRGISLRQFILQQSLSLKRSLDIVLQVAYALLHLHTHGVIHRDLKPENILITEEGEIKVIDFGIAMLHTERGSTPENTMGTPHYMSPEQKENPMDVTYATDIYALGIITFELVLGKLSYGMLNLSLLPKGLRSIIGKAIAISVKERYQDIVDFITEIALYLKSDAWRKDRSGGDEVKELLESIDLATLTLSPLLPHWPAIEVGMAKSSEISQLGLYYDFFHPKPDLYALFLSITSSTLLDSAIYSALLQGELRTFMHEKKEFSSSFPEELLRTLQAIHQKTPLPIQFAFHFLLLDSSQNLLTLSSAGFSPIYHLSRASGTPRELSADNPPLGTPFNGELILTKDNWNLGDTLVLHTLSPQFQEEERAPLPSLKESLLANAAYSAQPLSDTLLKKIESDPSLSIKHKNLKPHPRALITLQRID